MAKRSSPQLSEAGLRRGAEERLQLAQPASGLNLGLPISRAIIEAHGGRLWVESVEGRGASFHFSLPFSA